MSSEENYSEDLAPPEDEIECVAAEESNNNEMDSSAVSMDSDEIVESAESDPNKSCTIPKEFSSPSHHEFISRSNSPSKSNESINSQYEENSNIQEHDDVSHENIDLNNLSAVGSTLEDNHTLMSADYFHMDNDSKSDRFVGDRVIRAHQIEESVRKEMFKEYTFRPEIKPYGKPIKGEELPFYERVTKWQQQRQEDDQRNMERMRNVELEHCSFHPKINPKSKTVIKSRSEEFEKPFSERLYFDAGVMKMKKVKQHEDAQRLMDEKLSKECPFKPILPKNDAYAEVMPKYKIIVPKDNSNSPRLTEKERKECTFSPEIKMPPQLTHAKEYLNANVVDRLYRVAKSPTADSLSANNTPVRKLVPRKPSSGSARRSEVTLFSDRPVVDASHFIASNVTSPPTPMQRRNSSSNERNEEQQISTPEKGTPVISRSRSVGRALYRSPEVRSSTPTASEASQKRRPMSAPRERSNSISSRADDDTNSSITMSKASMDDMFERFLKKQQNYEIARAEKMKRVSKSLTPKFKPTLNNKHFVSGAEKIEVQGAFLDRLQRDILHRQELAATKAASSNSAPKISSPTASVSDSKSKVSSNYSQRSVADTKLIEKKREMLQARKQELEEAELQGATFAPKISPLAKHVKSKLGILSSDRSSFLRAHKEKQEQNKLLYEEMQKKREEEELRSCTFAPNVKECPGYIKRIKQSVDLMKKQSGTEPKVVNKKPDWN